MKWSLKPFVLDIHLQTFLAAKTAHCLDWVDVGFVGPGLNLDKRVMQWCTIVSILKINIDPKVNELLLSFKGSIC